MAEIATKITSADEMRREVPGLIGRGSSIAQAHRLALNRWRVERAAEPGAKERGRAMSGGKAYRHGYIATLPHTRPQPADAGVDFEGILIVIVASMLIVFVTALATDPSLLSTAEQSLRAMLSDLVRR
jgi:hypothetical protein